MVKKKYITRSSRSPKVDRNSPTSKGKDVSNRLVVIMLIVVILVSVVSMVVYLQALENAKPKVLVNGGVAQGEVKLTLVPASELGEEVVEEKSTTSSTNGQVSLMIIPND